MTNETSSQLLRVIKPIERHHSITDDSPTFHYGSMTFWLNGVLSLCLVILGIAGNVALMGSFRYKIKHWLALYFYFFTFAVWNTGLLVSNVLFNCLPGLLDTYQARWSSLRVFLEYALFVGYLLGNSCMTAIIWLVVAVTVERYVAVTRPFNSRLTSPKRRAKIVSFVISAAALFYNVPLMFEFSIGSIHHHRSPEESIDSPPPQSPSASSFVSEDSYSPRISLLRENSYYILIYRVVCNIVFLYAVPFLIIVVLTVQIVCTVSQTGQKRRLLKRVGSANNGIQETSHQAHLLLTFIVFKFLICYSLPVILNILELLLDESYTSESLAFAMTVDVSNFLVVGDSASNAFVYFSWRKRIRFYGLSVRKSAGYLIKKKGGGKQQQQHQLLVSTPSSVMERNGCGGGEWTPATRSNSTTTVGGTGSPFIRNGYQPKRKRTSFL